MGEGRGKFYSGEVQIWNKSSASQKETENETNKTIAYQDLWRTTSTRKEEKRRGSRGERQVRVFVVVVAAKGILGAMRNFCGDAGSLLVVTKMRRYSEYQGSSRGKKMRTLSSHGTKFVGSRKCMAVARERA